MKNMKSLMPKKAEAPDVIPARLRLALGHQRAFCGTGVIADRRTRRTRTRGAQQRHAISGY